MVDKHLLDQMEAVLSRLSIPVSVIDKDHGGNLPEEVRASLRDLAEGVPQAIGGMLYLPVKQPAVILSCPDKLPGAKDVLILGGALVASMGSSEHHSENCFDVYRRALRGELVGAELEALSNEHQLPRNMERCVMVFHMVQTGEARAFELLQDITPMQDKDVLIDMDRHTVALVKDMTDTETLEELTQYAQALQETLMGETAHQMTVGIGRSRHTIDELRESYDEAKRAIEVGRIFQPEDSIYVFSRLILERFLMELPQDISAYYHSLLFNRKTARLFNEEMLYTIDMFFKKDLNLSDTARQLYIHRNTLVYRLDKVQRQTGLDLRSFEDAVTFKILMELKKCGGEKLNRK
ncbi:MAG: helix-turn-helix domain-containing protein [Clostridia bacterium]|nr:helix-turn-helix domain-containing protein [Clostridia bacterium]